MIKLLKINGKTQGLLSYTKKALDTLFLSLFPSSHIPFPDTGFGEFPRGGISMYKILRYKYQEKNKRKARGYILFQSYTNLSKSRFCIRLNFCRFRDMAWLRKTCPNVARQVARDNLDFWGVR